MRRPIETDRFGPGSPCIDAGTSAAPNLPAYDFEGNARAIDGDGDRTATVDMELDEVVWHAITCRWR